MKLLLDISLENFDRNLLKLMIATMKLCELKGESAADVFSAIGVALEKQLKGVIVLIANRDLKVAKELAREVAERILTDPFRFYAEWIENREMMLKATEEKFKKFLQEIKKDTVSES